MRQFAVIGLGKFGLALARALVEKDCQVIAVDQDEEKVAEAADMVTQAIQLDATDEKAIKKAGLDEVDVAVVSVGQNMEASILITLMLKQAGIKEVVAKAINSHHARVLQKIGADRVVFPERDSGLKLAESLASPNILDQIKLTPDYEILEITAPKSFAGKTLGELAIRSKYKVNVIALKKKIPQLDESGKSDFKEEIELAVNGDVEVSAGDILVVIGKNEQIEQLRKVQ